jgi:hypothetical protein
MPEAPPPEAAGSRRGGKAGIQAGGSGAAAAVSAARPGQLHSPSVSIQTCVRDDLAAGIHQIQRTPAAKPKLCTNLPKHGQPFGEPVGLSACSIPRLCRRSRAPAWLLL